MAPCPTAAVQSLSSFGAFHSHGKTSPHDGTSAKGRNRNKSNESRHHRGPLSAHSIPSTASERRTCPNCNVASPSRTRALSSASCKNNPGYEGRTTRRGSPFRSLSWRLRWTVSSSLEQDFRMTYSSVQAPVAFPPLTDLAASSALTNTHMLTAQMYGSNVEGAEDTSTSCHILDRPSKKQVCLFYCSETEELAQRIASDSDAIELRSISWGQFKDGFPNLFVPSAHGIRNRHVAFLASFSSPAVIFEQLSIIYALPRMFISSFTLVLPFFPTGTQERMEDEGDVATAFTLARILSNIPISRGGPASVVIFDIHALQERFYFGDHVLPCFSSAIPLLKNRLHQLPDSDNITIAFPDEGAWKRFYRQLQHYPMVVCTKVRDGNNRIVTLKEGNPKGRHVVIVDDLVQSGSTLIECQKLLVSLGASSVSAYATHGVFPQRSWERFIHDPEGKNPKFTHFWITDSCPLTAKAVAELQPFEVLSLAGLIQSALQI